MKYRIILLFITLLFFIGCAYTKRLKTLETNQEDIITALNKHTDYIKTLDKRAYLLTKAIDINSAILNCYLDSEEQTKETYNNCIKIVNERFQSKNK